MRIKALNASRFTKCMLYIISTILVLTGCTAMPPSTSPAAMGRYIETDITPPMQITDNEHVSALGVFPHLDGSVDYLAEVLTVLGERSLSLRHYRSVDGGKTWSTIDTAWLETVAEMCGMKTKSGSRSLVRWMDMDHAQNIYCVAYDSSARLRLMKIAPDGSVSEIRLIEWQNADPDSGLTPRTLRVTENGNIGIGYFPRTAGAALYDGTTGEVLIDVYELSGEAFAFTDERVMLLGDNGKLLSYGADGEMASIDLPQASEGMMLAADANANLLLAGREGVLSLGSGQSVFETVMEGSLYQFSDPNTAIEEMRYQPETDTFYMLLRGGSGTVRLFRYTFDPKMPRRPDTQLNVFSLHDSGTVRRAMLEFQMNNPTVMINYQVGISVNSPLTQAEVSQALEAELAAGKGPDVLILDGLATEKFMENGWLAASHITSDARFQSSDMYRIPTRFTVSLDDKIETLSSLILFSETRESLRSWREGERLRVTAAEPAVVAGINAASGQPELATAFVHTMLSDTVQIEDYNDGMPVKRKAFDAQVALQTERTGHPNFPSACVPIRESVFGNT